MFVGLLNLSQPKQFEKASGLGDALPSPVPVHFLEAISGFKALMPIQG